MTHDPHFSLRTTADVTPRDVEQIYNALHAYNMANKESCQEQALGVFLENESGDKLAGLTGTTYGNWLMIKYLFVSEKLRGQRLGSRILRQAEREAVKRAANMPLSIPSSSKRRIFTARWAIRRFLCRRSIPIPAQGISTKSV